MSIASVSRAVAAATALAVSAVTVALAQGAAESNWHDKEHDLRARHVLRVRPKSRRCRIHAWRSRRSTEASRSMTPTWCCSFRGPHCGSKDGAVRVWTRCSRVR